MSEYTPQVGHRVAFHGEATVTEVHDYGFHLQYADGATAYIAAVSPITFERLSDPEPKWQPGALVMAADGNVYGYIGGPYPWARIHFIGASVSPAWTASNGIADPDVPRPLSPLIPEDVDA